MEFEEKDFLEAFGLEEEETDVTDEELDEDTEDLIDEDLDDDPEEDTDPEDEDVDESVADPFEAERERLLEQSQRDLEAALDAQAAGMGLVNPYTGEAITTNKQLQEFQARSRREKLDRVAKAAKLTEDELKELIDQHPDVAAGRQLRLQMERQAAEAQRAKAEQALAADIAAIGKLMPGVDTAEAVVKHESWPQVKKLMEDNPKLGLKNAFRLANADAIQADMGRKAGAAARRSAASKGHLKSAGGRSKGLPEVPEEVKRAYRAFEPGISDAEIRRDYAKNRVK